MKYADGSIIRLGDRVIISGAFRGVVVADIDGAEYSNAFLKEHWEYLKSGVLVDTDFGGIVYYQHQNSNGEIFERELHQENKV
ncbi:MAG: hypothetical protein GW763_17865 [Paraglaciecola sp.]|nr:hypothetical protein [Paraglaciecola sp.]NCT49822.1 hypothetical protein [Paraglaciecola sp.]